MVSNCMEHLQQWACQIMFLNIKGNFQFRFKLNRASQTHDATAEKPIFHQERLEIWLYRLSRRDYYHAIAEMIGRELATVQCITQDVCKTIVSNLWSEFVNFPEQWSRFTAISAITAISKMEDKWQFPIFQWNVFEAEMQRERSIIILKNFYSIIMMEIVGAGYKVLWASLGLPGSSNNACTFQASRLYQNIAGNEFLPEIQNAVNLPKENELQLSPNLLGDSAFHIMHDYENHLEI